MRLISLGCSCILGVYLASRFDSPVAFILVILIPLVLLFCVRRDKQTRLWGILCLFVFLGGVLRFQQTFPVVNEDVLQFYNERGVVEVLGVVDGDPEITSHSIRFTLKASEIRMGDERHAISGGVQVYAPRFSSLVESRDFPYYRYGDCFLMQGELEGRPLVSAGQEDELAGYWDYLARHGIYSVAYYPDIELIAEGCGFKPVEWLYDFRYLLSQSLASALPEPHGSLSRGLLLGMRGDIPESLLEDFSETGLRHIMAISGLHISIIAGVFLSIGVWLFGRRRLFYIALPLVAVWLYVLMSGARPSALRAGIMASLFLAADVVGRQRNAPVALTFAAAIMVGISPLVLWDISFQLSFLAMVGLTLLTPLFRNLGRRMIAKVIGDGWGVGIAVVVTDSFSVSLGAILVTLPLVAYSFHLLSLTTLPATFIALPVLPVIIGVSFLVAVIGIWTLPAACVLGWMDWLFISYLILVVERFAALPFVSISTDFWEAPIVWGYYIILALVIGFVAHRKRMKDIASQLNEMTRKAGSVVFRVADRIPMMWALISLVVVVILIWTAVFVVPNDELQVSILDVGQGDAILIQKGSRQIVIDGGPDPEKMCLELGEEMPFWDRNIDLLVLTHPQDDHLAGLVEVLRRYNVKQVLESGLEYEISVYTEWLKLIEEKDVVCTQARVGLRIDVGEGTIIDVLHPSDEFMEDANPDVNDSSVVLRLTQGDISFLFTGDIEERAERSILHRNRDGLNVTVLKVAHHGSSSSTSERFLNVIEPQVAVISVGEGNRFGHPDARVMERLAERIGDDNIYLTSEHGTITFTTDGEKLWVETEG